MGRYPMPPGASDIPGLECAGNVVKLGEGTNGFQVGDPVCALLRRRRLWRNTPQCQRCNACRCRRASTVVDAAG